MKCSVYKLYYCGQYFLNYRYGVCVNFLVKNLSRKVLQFKLFMHSFLIVNVFIIVSLIKGRGGTFSILPKNCGKNHKNVTKKTYCISSHKNHLIYLKCSHIISFKNIFTGKYF